jgi:hypothetical protein
VKSPGNDGLISLDESLQLSLDGFSMVLDGLSLKGGAIRVKTLDALLHLSDGMSHSSSKVQVVGTHCGRHHVCDSFIFLSLEGGRGSVKPNPTAIR